MRDWIVCGCALLISPTSQAVGQSLAAGVEDSLEDDYSAHFGRPQVSTGGPRSLEEARSQRRGYRLGQAGGAEADGSAAVHVVQPGDTLWSISGDYLGDHWQWPRLWSYNPEITNPHRIYPQHQVRLVPPSALAPTEQDVAAGPEQRRGTTSTRVVVIPDHALRPGMILLRDQGYLGSEALASVGEIMGAPEEHMALSLGDRSYVRFTGDQAPRAGEELAVFRQLQAWERFPAERGTLVRIVGTVTVDSFDPEARVARVTVSEALDVIERGFNVAKVERRFDLVEPKRNTRDLTAHIIASVEPRGLIGYGDVVFLDVGRDTGVEAGNRFFVVRRGDEFLEGIRGRESEVGSLADPPAYHPELMPHEVVAELRVVKVRKNTAIALVTRSDTDLAHGDTAEMRVGF